MTDELTEEQREALSLVPGDRLWYVDELQQIENDAHVRYWGVSTLALGASWYLGWITFATLAVASLAVMGRFAFNMLVTADADTGGLRPRYELLKSDGGYDSGRPTLEDKRDPVPDPGTPKAD